MNNLNTLSAIKKHSPNSIVENDDHHLLNSYIAQNLCEKKSCISGCMTCGAESLSEIPEDDREIIEGICRGMLNCSYCLIPDSLKDNLHPFDEVIVSFEDTTDVATVREVGDIVRAKRKKVGLYGELLPKVLRVVNENDTIILQKNHKDEQKAREIFRIKIHKYNLNMKLVDIHYQFDRNKLYFFYTSDGRVDFRDLAKDLAAEFKTRIELRQIGVRDEAKKVGGLGTCGREFCCSSFLNNFKRISTHLAAEQSSVASFSKLSGPCGKLKCCLSFELNSEIEETKANQQ